MKKNLLCTPPITALSLFSLKSNSQDVFGCDYIRKLNVNREKEITLNVIGIDLSGECGQNRNKKIN